MSNQMMKPVKRMTAALSVALITPLLLLFPIASVMAHSTESIEVQKEVDEALGVKLPEPATVHLQLPHTRPEESPSHCHASGRFFRRTHDTLIPPVKRSDALNGLSSFVDFG